jgi:hypothetical protein
MADALQSAYVKLRRANLHAGIARREARRFFKRQTDPVFVIKPDGEQSDRLEVGDVFRCKLVVETGWPDLPESFAARFGDAIHNYRSALDHVAWQLVSHGLRPPSTLSERQKRRVVFPAYAEETTFRDRIGVALPGVDQTVLDWIKARNDYVGGNSANDALVQVVDLSNNDKHRTLTAIAAAPASLQGHITFDHCLPVSIEGPDVRPALKKDAELQWWECRVTGFHPHVTMKVQPTIEIAVESRHGFGIVLEIIEREVREILNAPEIIAAVS